MVFSGTSALARTAFRLKAANMATGNEAYLATYALCRPFPAKGACYLRCPTLNRTLAPLNRLYIRPKHGEPRQASVVELNSPLTQQTCRDRAGHSGIFFLYYTKTDETGQRPYLQRGKEVALGAREVHSGQTAQRLIMPHPSYSCLHVPFCIASMRSTHKKSIEKQITLANLCSASAKRSCMYSVCRGGVNPPLKQAQE